MPTEKEYLLKEAAAAATYQEKLTAGANITISSNNVISATTDGGSDVSIHPEYSSGTLLMTATVDGYNYNVYNPDRVFTGATSTVNGEKGLVPKPYPSDVNNVLYGDGQWRALPPITTVVANPVYTPTATLEKLQVGNVTYEVDSGGGGSSDFEAIEILYTDYENLPTEEKNNPDILYMTKKNNLIYNNIDLTQSISKIESSGSMSVTNTSSSSNTTYGGGTSIGAELRITTPINFTNINEITYNLITTKCYGHNNSNVEEQTQFPFRVAIFRDISSSSWLDISTALTYNSHIYTNTTYTDNECILDTSDITGIGYVVIIFSGWTATLSNVQCIEKGIVSTEKNIYWKDKRWGSNFESNQLTLNEYNNLTSLEKQDKTQLYMVEDMTIEYDSYIDTTNFTIYKQSSVDIIVPSNREIDMVLSSGVSIGQTFYYNVPIDVTDLDTITYDITTGESYNTIYSDTNTARNLGIGVKSTYPTGIVLHNSMGYAEYNEYDDTKTNSTFLNETIDVSSLTGTYYFIVTAAGWNAEITNIRYNKKQYKEDNIYWNDNLWGSEIKRLTQSEYDALPSSKLTDNIVYFIHPEQILDPNYNYVYADNGKIIVRIYHEGESDEEIYWFFNNYSHSSGVYAIPSNLTDYYNTNTAQAATAYDPTTGNHVADIVVNQYGNMGIYVPGFGSFYTSPVNCKLSMNYPDNTVQNTTYEDPHVYINNDAYKIIFNGHEYVNTDIVTHEGLTPEEYELLPIDQKTNGEIYFISDDGTVIELVARMTSASSASEGTVSGYDTYPDREPWMAFRTDNSIDVSYVGEFWYGASTDAYIQFDFNNRVNITEIDFASNVAVTANISYSQDGVNYISGANLVYQNTSSCYKENFLLSEELTNCISIRIKPVTQAAIGCVHFIGYPASNNKIYYMGKNYTSGGSGSSSIKTTLLDVNTATSPMNLSDSIFNYDMIFLEIKDGNGYTRGVSFVPSILEIGQVIGFDNTYGYTWDTITSGTVLTNTSRSNFYIASIVGIKL